MRVLITGGAGFIGSHVADALLAAPHEVLVLDDLSVGQQANIPVGARFMKGDIRDHAFVARAFAEFRPEVVTHQAAQTSVSRSTCEPISDAEINVLGSLNILRECVKHDVQRFVFASTGGAIYGEVPEGKCASVDWTPSPLNPYACSKFAVEIYLHAFAVKYGLKSSVLRYANVYGPRQNPHGEAGVVAIFAQHILRGEPIYVNARKEIGDAGCIRDYVFVDDIVKANILAIEGKLAQSPLNICTGEPTTTLEIARLLENAAGVSARIRFAPHRPGDIERSLLAPMEPTLLGHPVPLREGIAKTFDWFRESLSRAA